MRTYEKKKFDEMVRLVRKRIKTGDSDFHRLAIVKAQELEYDAAKWCYLLDFVYAQVKFSRPTNSDIYESLKFINAKVVQE